MSAAQAPPPAPALAQSELLGLLSSMYLCKPVTEALVEWRNAMSDGVPEYLEELAHAIAGTDPNSPEAMQDLLWDYTRLFLGPYRLPCPPWESVYTSSQRMVLQEASDAARAAYAEAGVEVGASNVMPDHVGVELNFLSLLLEKIEANTGGEDACRRRARDFLDTHLRNWVPRFAADMGRAAQTAVFKALAQSTTAAIEAASGAVGWPPE